MSRDRGSKWKSKPKAKITDPRIYLVLFHMASTHDLVSRVFLGLTGFLGGEMALL